MTSLPLCVSCKHHAGQRTCDGCLYEICEFCSVTVDREEFCCSCHEFFELNGEETFRIMQRDWNESMLIEQAEVIAKDLLENQKSLDPESAKILRDNLWDLYVKDNE